MASCPQSFDNQGREAVEKIYEARAATAESPCIGVCLLDENDVCVGCDRHIQQIIDWPDMQLPPINLNNSLSADNFYPDDTSNKDDDSEEHW